MTTLKTKHDARSTAVLKVMLTVLALNLLVALAKIATGYLFDSASVRADGIHSIFDAASNVVALIGIAVAARPADASHPYGHGKYEAFGSLFIGILLLAAAYEVGWNALQGLLSGDVHASASPVSFAVMVVTICVNIGVTNYERRMGKKYSSSILGSDAKHTLSDALVSGSVIVGLVFVALGFPFADSLASLVVTVAIFATALSVFKDVQDTFSDEARIKPELIAECALEENGVRACHEVRSRGLSGEVYVDLHVLVDPQMTILQAHRVANAVEARIKGRYGQVKDVLVHLEPDVPEEHLATVEEFRSVERESARRASA